MVTVLMSLSCTDQCNRIDCRNGGICLEGNCDCPEGFLGDLCEIKDLCYGVTCAYDGECMDGSCVCIELTKDYIIGAWLFEGTNYVITFSADGNWMGIIGHMETYVVNTSSRTIDLYILSGNYTSSYIVLEEGFGCDRLNLGTPEGEISKVLIRQ